MSLRYYEPRKNIRLYYSTKAEYRCDKCNKLYYAGEWVTTFKMKIKRSDSLIETRYINEKISRNKKLIHCKKDQYGNEECGGKIGFYGYHIWVEDVSNEKTFGGIFRTGSKELESCYAETIKEREELINNLYEKYRK